VTEAVAPFLRLAGALAAAGVVLALLAAVLVGPLAVQGVGYSLLLCLVPGLFVCLRSAVLGGQPQSLATLLVGMGLRMAVVLVGALVICVNRPEMRGAAFLLWLVPMYCVALAVETAEMLRAEAGSCCLQPAVPESGAASLGSN